MRLLYILSYSMALRCSPRSVELLRLIFYTYIVTSPYLLRTDTSAMASNVRPHSLGIGALAKTCSIVGSRYNGSWPTRIGQPFTIYNESATAQAAKELTAANSLPYEHDNKENIQPRANASSRRGNMVDWRGNEPPIDDGEQIGDTENNPARS
jgi:hypothetical protein